MERIPADTTTSMQRDFRAHRSTELESLTGYIVREGKRLGVPTPTYDRMYSKFRFVVDAQRTPDCKMSSFMAKHSEQPLLRHSNPASLKISAKPSSSACFLTRMLPGTT